MVDSVKKIYEPKILDELLVYTRERWNEAYPRMEDRADISGGILDALLKTLNYVYSKIDKNDLINHFRSTIVCNDGKTLKLKISQ